MLSQCNSGMQCPPLPKRIKRTRLQESGRNKFIQDLGGEESHCRSWLTFPQRRPHTPTPTPTIQKRRITIKTARRDSGPTPHSLLPPCLRPRQITLDTLRHTCPRQIIPGTSGTRDQQHRNQLWPTRSSTYKPWRTFRPTSFKKQSRASKVLRQLGQGRHRPPHNPHTSPTRQ